MALSIPELDMAGSVSELLYAYLSGIMTKLFDTINELESHEYVFDLYLVVFIDECYLIIP